MKMILFVLHDGTKVHDLMNAWKKTGASGATVLFSTGMGRIVREVTLRDDLPLMPSLSDFYVPSEELSRTIFTIVNDDLVDRMIAVTEQIAGDLNMPGNGILVVLPIDQVRGLIEHKQPAPGKD